MDVLAGVEIWPKVWIPGIATRPRTQTRTDIRSTGTEKAFFFGLTVPTD